MKKFRAFVTMLMVLMAIMLVSKPESVSAYVRQWRAETLFVHEDSDGNARQGEVTFSIDGKNLVLARRLIANNAWFDAAQGNVYILFRDNTMKFWSYRYMGSNTQLLPLQKNVTNVNVDESGALISYEAGGVIQSPLTDEQIRKELGIGEPTPSPTPTTPPETPSPSPTPTTPPETPSPSPTPTTPPETPSPSPTPTTPPETPSPSPSPSPSPTPVTPTPTPTNTPSPAPTTPAPTNTPKPTVKPTTTPTKAPSKPKTKKVTYAYKVVKTSKWGYLRNSAGKTVDKYQVLKRNKNKTIATIKYKKRTYKNVLCVTFNKNGHLAILRKSGKYRIVEMVNHKTGKVTRKCRNGRLFSYNSRNIVTFVVRTGSARLYL